ncbi:MAG: hypothetical protein H7061_13375 [Bdellovibrionaceae bacterium]|nr:hypothetical protein [Bdellovibrio sp.]
MIQLITYFIFILVVSNQALAATRPQCSSIFAAASVSKAIEDGQARLTTEWDILDNMKDADKSEFKKSEVQKQALRVKREIMNLWSQLGIHFESDPENPYNLLVTIPNLENKASMTHPFNRMAYSISKNFGVRKVDSIERKLLRMGIDPFQLKIENSGALFNEQTASLTISRANVLSGQIDDMVIHESRHAYNFYKFANGTDHDFMGWISTSESLPIIHETYPHRFSADELSAYTKQLNLMIRNGIKDKTDFADAIDFTQTALQLLKTVNNPQVLTNSMQMMAALRSHPENWNPARKTVLKIEEEDTEVIMYTSSVYRTKIYFYESPLFDSPDENGSLKYTHGVIVNGDYTLDMLTLKPLDPTQMKPLYLTIEKKILGLQERAQKIEKHISELEAALKAKDAKQAQTAITNATGYTGL